MHELSVGGSTMWQIMLRCRSTEPWAFFSAARLPNHRFKGKTQVHTAGHTARARPSAVPSPDEGDGCSIRAMVGWEVQVQAVHAVELGRAAERGPGRRGSIPLTVCARG